MPSASVNVLQKLSIEQVKRSSCQPRTKFNQDDLERLASSIKEHGLVQPITVRKTSDGYELIAGERRWRAAQIAGFYEIDAVIIACDDEEARLLALVENIQREDLNAIEEGVAYKQLTEKGFTHQEVADAIGISRAKVTLAINLLDLEPRVRVFLTERRITRGHAVALLGLPAQRQYVTAARIMHSGLSVRQVEKLVRKLKRQEKNTSCGSKAVDVDVARLEMQGSDYFGAKYQIKLDGRGKRSGWVMVRFDDYDQLDGIHERMGLDLDM